MRSFVQLHFSLKSWRWFFSTKPPIYVYRSTDSISWFYHSVWKWVNIVIHHLELSHSCFFIDRANCLCCRLARTDLGAGIKQQFQCFLIQNRQVVQSMGSWMDWTM